MKRLPRKLKKQIKKMPVGNNCYGSMIGGKYKMVNGKRQYRGGCCPFWHNTKNEGVAYCSFLDEHNDFELLDLTKLIGCYYGRYFTDEGQFSQKLVEQIRRGSQKNWQTKTLENFLIIHEGHVTGLYTKGGSIHIENIPGVSISTTNMFHNWLVETRQCKNNIEWLKEHYRTGLAFAKRIKKQLGNEIIVEYWWLNPSDLKKGRKRNWEGLRIEENGWYSFRNEFEHRGWIPASPFDLAKALKEQSNQKQKL